MRARARGALAALVLLAVLGGGALQPARGAEPGVLRFTETLDVETLDPLLATTGNVADLSQLTMAHLTGFDPENAVVPRLATPVPTRANGGISADGRTVVYHLRRGVRWSDGKPFDADDVLFTLAVIADGRNSIPIAGNPTYRNIASSSKRDPWTVVLRLRRPDVELPRVLFNANTLSCILPKHFFSGTAIGTSAYNGRPIGIGPFRYTAFRRGDSIEMEANPYWYGTPPKLRRIVYRLITDFNTAITQLQTGELDLLVGINGTDVDRVRALTGKHLNAVLSTYMAGVYLNVTSAPTNDRVVRRALELATDRSAIFHRIVRGNGALTESMIPRMLPGSTGLPLVPFDPVRAGALLDGDGWKLGADGIRHKGDAPLAVELAFPSGYAPASQMVEELRAAWKRAGIGLNSRTYAVGMFFAPTGPLFSGHFNAALLSYSVGQYGDLDNALGCAAVPPHGFNVSRYCSHVLDDDLQRIEQEDDPVRRARLARDLQVRIAADVPVIVTYERAILQAYDARLQGVRSGTFVQFYRPEALSW